MSRFRDWPYHTALTLAALALSILYVPPLWAGVRVLLSETPGAGLGDGGETARRTGLLLNTLAVSVGATLLSGATGLLAVSALRYVPARLRLVAFFLLVAPLAIPPYVLCSGWLDFWGTSAVFNMSSIGGAILVLGLAHFPFVVLTACYRLTRLPRAAQDAGHLYRGERATFCNIILPVTWPGALGGLILAFLFNLTNFSVPNLLQVQVYPAEIFAAFSAFYDTAGALRLCLPLAAIGLSGALLLGAVQRAHNFPMSGDARWPEARPSSLSIRIAACAVILVIVLLSFGIPLGEQIARATSLGVYRESWGVASGELFTSLWTAAVAATLMMILAFLAAHAARGNKLWRSVGVVGLVPCLLSGAALGILFIQAWNRPGIAGALYDSGFILIIGSACRYTVLLYFGCRAFLALVPPQMEDAARVVGISQSRTLLSVTLPLLAPALAGGWCVAFLLAFTELDVAALTYPPGMTTLPVRVFSLLHYGPSGMTAALNVLVSAVVLALAAGSILLIRWGAGRLQRAD